MSMGLFFAKKIDIRHPMNVKKLPKIEKIESFVSGNTRENKISLFFRGNVEKMKCRTTPDSRCGHEWRFG